MFRYLPEHVKDDIFQESFLILWTEIQNRTIYSKEKSICNIDDLWLLCQMKYSK